LEYSADEGSFGGLFGLHIRLIIFSGLIVLKRGVFRILDLISIICTIMPVFYRMDIFCTACHDFWILHSKFGGFGFKARGLRDTWRRLLIFSNLIEKVSKEDSRLM
jgi:hypothetical protein